MKIGSKIKCDVCGRQIVSYNCNNKHIVGPAKIAMVTDIDTHICHVCQEDPLVREQEGIPENWWER